MAGHLPNCIRRSLEYIGWIAVEAAFGLCIGLLVGFLADSMLLFGQIFGLQAGFSFASTIDPNTQADAPSSALWPRPLPACCL